MSTKLILTAVAALASAVIGSAYGAKSMENDALAVSNAKIDLSQAVSTAERHVGGKASRAEYEHHKGLWVFDVEVVKGKQVMDVKVDPMNGRVLVATEDKADRDDDHDPAD